MSVLIVGSIALDTVKTPVEEHADQLGGSASYAALGASFFSPVNLVGVVGDDFPESEFEFWKSRKIDTSGVQRANGKTFRWSGEYAWDMNTRETRSVALNVFEHFRPTLPDSYRETRFRFTGEHRAGAAIARARSNETSALRRGRYDGPLDSNDAPGS